MRLLSSCLLACLCLSTTAAWSQHSTLPHDSFFLAPGETSELPLIEANDNRTPAGIFEDNEHRINLTVARGVLYPNSTDDSALQIAAVGETGTSLSIPAPLIRVREGEWLAVSVSNTLSDSTITVFGLQERPIASPDSLVLKPGEKGQARFRAGSPGTYLYKVLVGTGTTDSAERDLTHGAFIVDAADDDRSDRVFVMNVWSKTDSTQLLGGYNAVMINGKSWPYTERITADVGVAERWHVINATDRNHPMHLHGFYYDVLRMGSTGNSTSYAAEERPHVVTQTLRGYQTMALEWTPAREGDWLFHCHLSFHVSEFARLPGTAHSMDQHMAGLAMGIHVREGDSDLIERGAERHLRLTLTTDSETDRFSFLLEDSDNPDLRIHTDRAPRLTLRQYQPTYVTVVNHSNQRTGVHWHGLELDAWADGVPGFSASKGMISPIIATDSSFTYKLTLMRPGTFMYHSHLNDIEQLARGMYGPILVLPEQPAPDVASDELYIYGWRSPLAEQLTDLEVNGISMPNPQPSKKTSPGEEHRLRLMNIAAASNIGMSMTKNGEPYPFLLVAKDGADLPEERQMEIERTPRLFVGETIDVLFVPDTPGQYKLAIGPGGPAQTVQVWDVE